KLKALEASSRLRDALKREQEEIQLQESTVAAIAPQIYALVNAAPEQRYQAGQDALASMRQLKDQVAHAKPEENRKTIGRALAALRAQGFESGQAEFEAGHYENAANVFQFMAGVSDEPWPSLLLAEARLAMGNKKQAIKDLREAVKRGITDPSVF